MAPVWVLHFRVAGGVPVGVDVVLGVESLSGVLGDASERVAPGAPGA